MADETAERIAALGGSPCGTPGALAEPREPDFIAEAYLKGPLISVAQATGLA
jgi:DNA-binding ferritin-like protein